MNKYSLLSMKDLTKQDIIQILDDALLFSDKYKDWQLPCSKALVANLFLKHRRGHTTHLKAQNCSLDASRRTSMSARVPLQRVKPSTIQSRFWSPSAMMP